MRVFTKSLTSALIALSAVSLPAQAYEISFGNAYVPSPGHGLLLVNPQIGTTGQLFAGWSLFSAGIADKLGWGPVQNLGLTIDTTYVSVPGFKTDWANTLMALFFGMGQFADGKLSFALSPLAAIKTGELGRSLVGCRAYLDWHPTDRFTLYSSPGYYFNPDGQPNPHRIKLDMCVDYKITDWCFADLEVLTGSPFWDYGPNTQVAIGPGATFLLGPLSLQTVVRIPVVKSATAQNLEAPIAVLSFGHAW